MNQTNTNHINRPLAAPSIAVEINYAERHMLTVKQASARLQISASLIYALCARGAIAHHRCGLGRGTIRIDEKALEEFLEQSKVIVRKFPQSLSTTFGHLDSSRLIAAWKQQGVIL